jgi:hypothetical protein
MYRDCRRSPSSVHITWYEYEGHVRETRYESDIAENGLADVEVDLTDQEADYGLYHTSTTRMRNDIRKAEEELDRIQKRFKWLENEAERL